MTTTKEKVNGSEFDAIIKAVQPYIDGAKAGRGDDMKPAFHKDAMMFTARRSGYQYSANIFRHDNLLLVKCRILSD